MHAAGKLGVKRPVDQAMALEPALPGERRRHDIHPEMALAAGAMAGVPFVPMGFVDHPQAVRPESLGQLPCDQLLDPHGPGLGALPRRRQRTVPEARNESKPFVKLAAGGVRSA